MTPNEKPYVFEVGGVVVGCMNARAAADLIRELQGDDVKHAKPRKPHVMGLTARKALLEGQYRVGVDILLANPEGVFAEDIIAKLGMQDNPKGFGGYMTGLRGQCRKAGLPDDAISRVRKKNGTGWKNHISLDAKAAETVRKWAEEERK